MPDYRLYFLDRHSGHIRSALDLRAEDDSTAIDLAEQTGSEPWELWTGARKVFRLNASPEIAESRQTA